MQEENLTPYVRARWTAGSGDQGGPGRAFWTADPHRKSVHDQYASGTVPFEFTKNYKFTILNNENVWAKAMNRVVNEKVPSTRRWTS
jgi:multiple sugar transport system substrate-binding protein